jgi:hypothetical protein
VRPLPRPRRARQPHDTRRQPHDTTRQKKHSTRLSSEVESVEIGDQIADDSLPELGQYLAAILSAALASPLPLSPTSIVTVHESRIVSDAPHA